MVYFLYFSISFPEAFWAPFGRLLGVTLRVVCSKRVPRVEISMFQNTYKNTYVFQSQMKVGWLKTMTFELLEGTFSTSEK